MQRWEYYVELLDIVSSKLNELGANRWELIYIREGEKIWAYFKRPKEEE